VENTFQALPRSPAAWGSSGSILVNGTVLGTAGQKVCTISVSTGAGEFSCQGWTDYGTQAVLGVLRISPSQRWATPQSSFTDTTGGNQHTSGFFSQVLEGFQYSLVGSITGPSAPTLNYTSFGSGNALPLVGSASSVWLDSGTNWSVPAALSGSTSSERWESTVTSGAATAGETASLQFYHQFLVEFQYSVVGGGTAYSAPSTSFTAFGVSAKGSQGWVDAGAGYNYTNPLTGSTAVERWSTSSPLGAVSGAGTVSATYYHQYAFVLNFGVAGGGLFSDPLVNYSSLGSGALAQLSTTKATIWVDAGTKWGLTPLLPSSTSSERWITEQAPSGTALAPLQADFLYQHQYLAMFSYTVLGTGGSPPVPQLNYTFYGATVFAPLTTSAGPFWLDSGSAWGVTPILPGGHGERWSSNVTGSGSTTNPFRMDARYAHQFFVEVGVSTVAGGSVANTNDWVDQGSSVSLRATSADLWSFAYWHGATPFSYNGTDITPDLTVSGPANETAIFFPGMTISSQSQGSVAYVYGSINGTVPAGGQSTIYVPPGKDVTLTAIPVTFQIMFSGWTGALTGAQLQTSLAIASPVQVHAAFATDYTDIRTFVLASIVVTMMAVYALVVRRRPGPKAKRKRGGSGLAGVGELAKRFRHLRARGVVARIREKP